ncbi:Uncharacterized HTH-type transcriptional regulator YqhC [Limnobacter sp. 130]|uniref:AraC family transcriptional regulator n=1 Tax=Limnobacter sp. 130 TaxID=2653147 RepID=UPI0012EF94C2|nr:AraC family transcriptional regulator [Limnobacter sp. 130]VWX32492.1 Uncharacterized HTH-type transcriptional regulator YqhC [Limnobacter sp. 130]
MTDKLFGLRHPRMVAMIQQLATTEGYSESALNGVTFMRCNGALARMPALYEPSIVIVIQGTKHGFHDGNTYTYDANHYLVVSVPLPFDVETQATAEKPLLGLIIRVEFELAAELILDLKESVVDQGEAVPPLFASRIDARLGDSIFRLLEILQSPTESRVLGPSVIKEITYRVLTGEQGRSLRLAFSRDSYLSRVAKVLKLIHSNYHRALDVATLAQEANMSVPTFHAHFKSVTSNTPIQYIKAIRLHQARLMMIRKGISAAQVSAMVGYESPSQFSREFKRYFGRTPVQESQYSQSILALS